jgi:hypothetical protein
MYSWYVPFTYSIETIGSADRINTTRVNISNLYSEMVWMVAEEENKIINISQPIKPSNYILANLECVDFTESTTIEATGIE